MMTDVEMEMRDEEMRDEKKSPLIHEIIRMKVKGWTSAPYKYQIFNKEESPDWRRPRFTLHPEFLQQCLENFYESCDLCQSFDFSIEPTIVGKVKHCSYSELDDITNFKTPRVIRNTHSGRLFHGTIVEGSEKRPAIVKTWDFLLPMKDDGSYSLTKFCDEIELFTDERVNTHPNLAKLYGYCVERRLAVVFDEKFTGRVLSDVLRDDDFGWHERMKVVTQLADLFSSLHEKKFALGCFNTSCIMIDEEANIKLFDHGYATVADSSILDQPRAPEMLKGERTMKADIFMVGFVLLELIAKKKFTFSDGPYLAKISVIDEAKRGEKYLVHECFREVDHSTAFNLTLLAFQCVDIDPDKRPEMNDVLNALNAMSLRGVKRKIDHENKAEQNKR